MIVLKFILLLGGVGFLAGCNDLGVVPPEPSEQVSKGFQGSDPLGQASGAFERMTALEEEFTAEVVDTIGLYLPIVSQGSLSRMGDINSELLAALLPADLSTLKRPLSSDSLARSQARQSKEINLQEELDALGANYKRRLEALIPDPTAALSLPYVDRTEGALVLGGDGLIPLDTPEGALTVELLNGVARGAQPVEPMTRGFYTKKAGTRLWKGGVVVYRWGSIKSRHKEALLEAMKTWNRETGGKVRFEEFQSNGWDQFLVNHGLKDIVTISNMSHSGSSNGRATIGATGNGSLEMDSILTKNKEITRTAHHELGHVLGLLHEHQRYDRDEWINVIKKGSNYDKIPKFIGPRGASYTFKAFDVDSVMLYEGFRIKKGPRKGTVTVKKPYPSKTDALTVRSLY